MTDKKMEDELLLLSKLCSDDYEANQVMAEMQTTIKEVEESEYYCNMVQQLQKNGSMFKDNILRVLGCSSDEEDNDTGRLQMVIYGLGSIQFSYFSQYQLSLAFLLRRDFSHWIGGIIEVYDPRGTTPVDAKVMKALGCKVLISLNNKLHKRVAEDERCPKLFFMPHAPCTTVVKDLLLANWCPSRLNNMVLFTDSFHIAVGDLQKLKIKTIDDADINIIGLGDETLMNNLPKTNLELDCDGGHGCDGRLDDETKYLLKTNVEYTLLELDCDGRPCKPEEYCSKESLRRGVPCGADLHKWPFTHLNWHFFNFFDDVHQLEALLLPETKLTEKMRTMRDGKEEEENDEYKLVQADDHKLSSCLNFFLRKDEELAFMMDNNPYKFKDWSQLLCNGRYPSRPSKRIWYPPSTGWIKLNFSAVVGKYKDGGREAIAVVGYGGIFHNENHECLLTYSIPLLEEEEEEEEEEEGDDDEDEDEDAVDLDFANADALRKGLRLYMDLRYSAKTMDMRKLVIEGDSVSIVRWVNGVFPPPKRLVEVFEEIHDLLSSIDEHVVFHIYKEANSMAIELANKGAKLLDQEIVSW